MKSQRIRPSELLKLRKETGLSYWDLVGNPLPKYDPELGGYASPDFEVDATYPHEQRVIDTMNASNAEFMQRLRNNDTRSILNSDGSVSTHLMSWDDNYAFPMILDINGTLKDYRKVGNPFENDDYILFPTQGDARYFSEHYKKYFPKYFELFKHGTGSGSWSPPTSFVQRVKLEEGSTWSKNIPLQVKQAELLQILGPSWNQATNGERLAMLDTYYNTSPKSFKKYHLPLWQKYLQTGTYTDYKALQDSIRNRWLYSPKRVLNGIRKRAAWDASLMNDRVFLDAPGMNVAQPDATTVTKPVIQVSRLRKPKQTEDAPIILLQDDEPTAPIQDVPITSGFTLPNPIQLYNNIFGTNLPTMNRGKDLKKVERFDDGTDDNKSVVGGTNVPVTGRIEVDNPDVKYLAVIPPVQVTALNLMNYRSAFNGDDIFTIPSNVVINGLDNINTKILNAIAPVNDYIFDAYANGLKNIANNIGQSYSDNAGTIYDATADNINGKSRLGMLGLIRDSSAIANNNYAVWHMPIKLPNESQSQYEKRCAKFANIISLNFGRPTAGDAWTLGGIFGDSTIVNGYSIPKFGKYSRIKSELYNRIAAQNVANNIDNHLLQTGDIVGLYYGGSPKSKRAWREGFGNTANTHTGRILRTGPDKKDTFVIHNESGNILVLPIGDMLGPFHQSGITYIKRPLRQSGYSDGKDSGIHIKPSHRGRFTRYLKSHPGMTAEKAKRSKNASVRRMATFALNARKWNN